MKTPLVTAALSALLLSALAQPLMAQCGTYGNAYEPNNNVQLAMFNHNSVIAPNGAVADALGVYDVDFYRVTVPQYGTLTVQIQYALSGTPIGTPPAPILKMKRLTGDKNSSYSFTPATLAGPVSSGFQITQEAVVPGEYYIEVDRGPVNAYPVSICYLLTTSFTAKAPVVANNSCYRIKQESYPSYWLTAPAPYTYNGASNPIKAQSGTVTNNTQNFTFQLVTANNPNLDKYLIKTNTGRVMAGAANGGGYVVQQSENGQASQQWQLIKLANGKYQIKNVQSGGGLMASIDPWYGQTSVGVNSGNVAPLWNLQSCTSGSLRLSSNAEGATELSLYPNPARETLMVKISGTEAKEAVLQITDLTGKTVLSRSVQVQEGVTELSIPIGNLNRGLYFVSFSDGSVQLREKVVLE